MLHSNKLYSSKAYKYCLIYLSHTKYQLQHMCFTECMFSACISTSYDRMWKKMSRPSKGQQKSEGWHDTMALIRATKTLVMQCCPSLSSTVRIRIGQNTAPFYSIPRIAPLSSGREKKRKRKKGGSSGAGQGVVFIVRPTLKHEGWFWNMEHRAALMITEIHIHACSFKHELFKFQLERLFIAKKNYIW